MPANPIQKVGRVMMRLMARIMPSCKEVSKLVSDSMDRKLPLRQRLSIRLHVLMCALCRRYEKQLHQLRGGASHYANPEENAVEQSLSREATERLKATLERGRN